MNEELFSVEYSQWSDDHGLHPFHVGPLSDAVEHNLEDFWRKERGPNKWQIVLIGTSMECAEAGVKLFEINQKRKTVAAKRGTS